MLPGFNVNEEPRHNCGDENAKADLPDIADIISVVKKYNDMIGKITVTDSRVPCFISKQKIHLL